MRRVNISKRYSIVIAVFGFCLILLHCYKSKGAIRERNGMSETFMNNLLKSLSAEEVPNNVKLSFTIPDVLGREDDATPLKIYNAKENKFYPITLVTAYFPFEKSKHSIKDYEYWTSNFLSKISTPVVIYADKRNASLLMDLRIGKPTVLFEYDSIWDLPPVSRFQENYMTDQYKMDPENFRHSPELYAIWNSKAWMLSRVSQLNPFNSTYFFWLDIGCFREYHTFENWPDINKVNEVFKDGTSTKMQVFAVGRYPTNAANHYSYQEASSKNVIMGGMFGGPAKGIRIWSKVFYYIHDYFLYEGLFVGKDQNLVNYIGIILQNYLTVMCACGRGCAGDWFYFLHWYAAEQERSQECDISPFYDMVDYIR